MEDNEDTLKKLKQQHYQTYKHAIIDNINNNTSVLCDEDIMSLLKKPPLDSMDSIKMRFLTLAKKNHIVLNTESLTFLVDEYRSNLIKCVKKVKRLRIDNLVVLISSFEKNEAIIKILKKDFNVINKKIKAIIKEQYNNASNKFLNNINSVFLANISEDIKNKLTQDMTKFVNITYERQLMENIDIKILIKDMTLISLVKEQTERYLFTLENSRLFKDNI